MDTYIKRLQTRANRQGVKLSKPQIREVYEQTVRDKENPTEAEMGLVLGFLLEQHSTALAVTSETEIIEITPENNPDIWEILQPPAEQPQPEPTEVNALAPQPEPVAELNAIASVEPTAELTALTPNQEELVSTESESAITTTESTQSQQLTVGSIPQGQVEELVSQAFAGQSQDFKAQVTGYALQHSFDDVRQVQEFLEQLRSMEFNMLTRTLQDHLERRDSMLAVLNEVLTSQTKKDEVQRQDFFASARSRLANFQQEMEARLSKTGI